MSESAIATRPFGTLVPAMVTPFTEDGAVDYKQAAALANKLVDDGCDGILVTGTTGETSTLTDEENLGMFQAVLDAVGDRARVIAGTGTNDTRHSISLSRRAAALGVHGLLIVTPYYNKPSQAGIQAHFTAIADSTDLPVMLYDIPGRAGVPIATETIIKLADHPRITALKDAKADFSATTRVLANTDLDVYSGDDGLTLPLMAAGAVGLVSVSAHVAPQKFRALVDAAAAGDFATARRLHFELDPVVRATMGHIQGAVSVKQILKWQGILPTSVVRLPLVEPGAAEIALIKADLAEAGMEL
ncbi:MULTISPECIES: 4-hydroxy-tetrahydrodipicolinate synthase [unclassified Arthrobacter]|uniref:4-hydroxy-tetrahydrodipicolinate synthase n=1 Tax=unclassified Arthrobacter TaxID=235627 RepID=UPI00159E522B|nr:MULTISPECIES: 4-hydroxy-tetrahydrodipicolinate synthase [unclassified Arthrobacter]MCQ9165611.1 4-hydroxy-tetrahydrodipicolinate synthase [Arthrobacter sp. STN4]NVM99344.1 4-hydroxy-tetrahydrodipicolinate synthase [Arthrobacter sp. SDTb3-6]